jgi:hypothetical protein
MLRCHFFICQMNVFFFVFTSDCFASSFFWIFYNIFNIRPIIQLANKKTKWQKFSEFLLKGIYQKKPALALNWGNVNCFQMADLSNSYAQLIIISRTKILPPRHGQTVARGNECTFIQILSCPTLIRIGRSYQTQFFVCLIKKQIPITSWSLYFEDKPCLKQYSWLLYQTD